MGADNAAMTCDYLNNLRGMALVHTVVNHTAKPLIRREEGGRN